MDASQASSPAVIPGFYWDPIKQKYFKETKESIEKNRAEKEREVLSNQLSKRKVWSLGWQNAFINHELAGKSDCSDDGSGLMLKRLFSPSPKEDILPRKVADFHILRNDYGLFASSDGIISHLNLDDFSTQQMLYAGHRVRFLLSTTKEDGDLVG